MSDPRDTAPQPPPVQLSQQQVIEALERGQLALLDRVAALEAHLAEAQARLERIHAIVTRLLAEPGNHTEQLVEIATICEARADELEGK